jgi:hypothetical protein
MMECLEAEFHTLNIPFVASEARMRCLPHVINLAAKKLQY